MQHHGKGCTAKASTQATAASPNALQCFDRDCISLEHLQNGRMEFKDFVIWQGDDPCTQIDVPADVLHSGTALKILPADKIPTHLAEAQKKQCTERYGFGRLQQQKVVYINHQYMRYVEQSMGSQN